MNIKKKHYKRFQQDKKRVYYGVKSCTVRKNKALHQQKKSTYIEVLRERLYGERKEDKGDIYSRAK